MNLYKIVQNCRIFTNACHISCGWSRYMGTCQMIGDTKDSRVRVVVNNESKRFRALSVYSA